MTSGIATVMIPSYNYAGFLTECVESAASQEHADVVIVDNGSTDGSPEMGARLAETYDNVRFVRYETNDGIIASFNRCRQEIRGEYAVLLPADDKLAPGSLRRSVEFMNTHPGVGLAYGRADFFLDGSVGAEDQGSSAFDETIVHAGPTWIERLCRTIRDPILTPEAIMRSSVLERIGPYEPSCVYTSDLNTWLRIAHVSDIAYLRGPPQAFFRTHDSNLSWHYAHGSINEFEQIWTAFAAFFETIDGDPRGARWEAQARRSIAAQARYLAGRAFVGLEDGEPQAAALLEFAGRVGQNGPTKINDLSWRVRRALGPERSKFFPGFLPVALGHRLAKTWKGRRMKRTGLA